MNTTRKVFFGLILAICILGHTACTTDSDDGLYESLDKSKITKPETDMVDRTKITKPKKDDDTPDGG